MQQYLDLLKTINETGSKKKPARENMPGSKSIFGEQFRHNLADGFPLLTTKKMAWKAIKAELLWFLRGDINIKYLVDQNVHIWDQDAYNYYQKLAKDKEDRYDNRISFKEFKDTVTVCEIQDLEDWFEDGSNYTLGDCGFQYGRVWRDWTSMDFNESTEKFYPKRVDQITDLIHNLKTIPESRRHVVSAWDPAHLNDLALTWCHALFQFNCRPLTDAERASRYYGIMQLGEKQYGKHVGTYTDPNDNNSFTLTAEEHLHLDKWKTPVYKLDCKFYQRSADMILGVPFNIASYALLTHFLAEICNMVPGDLIPSFGDAHIYDNHAEATKEQLSRTPTDLPNLIVFPRSQFGSLPTHYEAYLKGMITLSELLSNLTVEDFKINNYHPQPAIEAELSTGLTKQP